MHRDRLLIGIALLSAIPLAAGATDLAPLRAAELLERCRTYLDSPRSAGGRACAAYVRGYVAGSDQVIVREDPGGNRGESFTKRALRTRLGRPLAREPQYCIDSGTSLRGFIEQLVAYAESQPADEDAGASALLIGTLERFHRC